MDWGAFLSHFRGYHTLIMIVVFVAICVWAFSPHRRKSNEEAANLPFDDEDIAERTRADQREKKEDE